MSATLAHRERPRSGAHSPPGTTRKPYSHQASHLRSLQRQAPTCLLADERPPPSLSVPVLHRQGAFVSAAAQPAPICFLLRWVFAKAIHRSSLSPQAGRASSNERVLYPSPAPLPLSLLFATRWPAHRYRARLCAVSPRSPLRSSNRHTVSLARLNAVRTRHPIMPTAPKVTSFMPQMPCA